jgi:hypothetical protein
MKHAALAVGLLWAIFLTATGTPAQGTVSPLLLADPTPIDFSANQNSLFLPAAASAAAAAAAAEPQGVQGVFNKYDVQVYGGYTFVRFYEVPHVAANMNGLNFSAIYYPRDWIGYDGEMIAVFGSQGGTNTHLFSGMAGPRFRWTTRRGFELWAHVMVGGAYFSPKTPYGSQGALAYEGGGGIDLSSAHTHVAIRLSADMLGAMFFSTYQLSPKVSAGIVYKF